MASSASCLNESSQKYRDIRKLLGDTLICPSMALNIHNQYSLVEISDKAEAPALLGSIVLRDVDIANPPILVKQTLEIISGGPEIV